MIAIKLSRLQKICVNNNSKLRFELVFLPVPVVGRHPCLNFGRSLFVFVLSFEPLPCPYCTEGSLCPAYASGRLFSLSVKHACPITACVTLKTG
jgi:hypothetical protein